MGFLTSAYKRFKTSMQVIQEPFSQSRGITRWQNYGIIQQNHLANMMATMARTGDYGMSAFTSSKGVNGVARYLDDSFETYREMCRHPTIALGLSLIKTPILSNSWSWEKDEEVSEKELDFIQKSFDRLLPEIIRHSLTALQYGFAPAEICWEYDDLHLKPCRFKPLLVDLTEPLVKESTGEITGIANIGLGQDNWTRLFGIKYYNYVYDNEAGNYFGRARLENIRDTFSEAKDIRQKFAKYLKKVSGVIVQLHFPEGTGKTEGGAEFDNMMIAKTLLAQVAEGNSVAFPNLFGAVENVQDNAQLAGKSQWQLSILEADKNDITQGFVDSLSYYDRLLLRGLYRPEREAIEASGGTKSDAATHGEKGDNDCDLVSQDIFRYINAKLVNDCVVANFGEKYKDKIRVIPAPLSRDSKWKGELVKAIIANPLSATGLLEKIGMDALLEDLKIPIEPGKRGALRIVELQPSYSDPRTEGPKKPDNNLKKKDSKNENSDS